MLLLCSLRGSIIIYQGEELGLPQVDVPFDQLQDPEAIANWPQTLSRDGARTPMPWSSAAPNLGFSTSEPWLPVGQSHRALAVDAQEASTDSNLQFTRECLKLRSTHRALQHGSMRIVEAGEQRLVFDRDAWRRPAALHVQSVGPAGAAPVRAQAAHYCRRGRRGARPLRRHDRGGRIKLLRVISAFALSALEERGVLFISPGDMLYEGMVIGENAKPQDLEVNPLKSKQLTNFRASGPKDEGIRLTPPRRMSLEQAIAYIQEDELVEVTPKVVRIRKRYLDPHERKRAARKLEAA